MTHPSETPRPEDPPALSREELRQLLFSTLRPAAGLAETLELTLAELRELVEVAYFQRALRSGKRKGAIRDMFDVGATKAAELSHQLKQHFLSPEREGALPRQVLALLGAGPLSRAQIGKALPDAADADIDAAIEQLEEEKRLRHVKGRTLRYAPARSLQRLALVPWLARLDGLNTLMDHVALAIRARFERRDDRALVRNLSFQIAPEDAEALQALYEQHILPEIVRIDARAQDAEASTTVKLSILWAPEDDASE